MQSLKKIHAWAQMKVPLSRWPFWQPSYTSDYDILSNSDTPCCPEDQSEFQFNLTYTAIQLAGL